MHVCLIYCTYWLESCNTIYFRWNIAARKPKMAKEAVGTLPDPYAKLRTVLCVHLRWLWKEMEFGMEAPVAPGNKSLCTRKYSLHGRLIPLTHAQYMIAGQVKSSNTGRYYRLNMPREEILMSNNADIIRSDFQIQFIKMTSLHSKDRLNNNYRTVIGTGYLKFHFKRQPLQFFTQLIITCL